MKINRYIDHAVLKPHMSETEVKEAIQLGIAYDVFSVCVRPCDIDLALSICEGTNTKVSCVLDFPHGDSTAQGKAALAMLYAKQGVEEIDMVVNYGFIRSAKWAEVKEGIKAVVDSVKEKEILVKVILETCCLNDKEIRKVTEIAIEADADFVKTSTGFSISGADQKSVQAMLEAGKDKIKVKASGGISSYKQAKDYLDMGVERLGVGFTSTPKICDGETGIINPEEGQEEDEFY